tara:strand:- start:235 stop:435 length:201 start_codon:yes stop_codon:yes gene_type:complete
MVDQTKDRIQEVQTANHARKYEDDTKKLIDKWISKCPVKIVKREDTPPGFVYEKGEISLTLVPERK